MLSYYLKWEFTISLPKHALYINIDKSRSYQDQCLC